MNHPVQGEFPEFGGTWTEEKLDALRKYLGAFTKVMKNRNLAPVYIDAFAGAGKRREEHDDIVEFRDGSAKIALEIDNPPFEKLVFVEKNPTYVASLNQMVSDLHAEDRVRVIQDDANRALPSIIDELDMLDRAVLFVDPFGTEMQFQALAGIARHKGVDVWILFPVGLISRFYLTREQPTDPARIALLNQVFGSDDWVSLYDQQTLFGGHRRLEDNAGINAMTEIYRRQLIKVFARVAPESISLRNSKNVRQFELLFAMTNPSRKAQAVALRIANHIIRFARSS